MTALLAVPLMLLAGGGVDFIRHETTRVRLQDALDNGVLAAASLTQTKPARETIEGYLQPISDSYEIDLDVEENLRANARLIRATATAEIETTFLQLAGIRTLAIPATAAAEERRPNVEISILLDISGSMEDNKGIYQLKPAAKQFIDTILRPDVRSVTSVNLIPYAGQVSIGQPVFDYLVSGTSVREHGWSSCFEFNNGDFNSTGVPNFRGRKQTQHFTYYNHKADRKQPWWCPTDDAAVMVMTNDADALKQKIEDLQVFDGTGSAYAMKWGAMLLDPEVRPYIAAGAAANVVSPDFADRPADYDDEETMKFIVLMTDGQITFQRRPKTGTYYYQARHDPDFTELFSQSRTESQLEAICRAAKDNGVIVFTIGFKLTEPFATKLARCASSASHAYRAEGLDIAQAFTSIATTIQRIRLTN